MLFLAELCNLSFIRFWNAYCWNICFVFLSQCILICFLICFFVYFYILNRWTVETLPFCMCSALCSVKLKWVLSFPHFVSLLRMHNCWPPPPPTPPAHVSLPEWSFNLGTLYNATWHLSIEAHCTMQHCIFQFRLTAQCNIADNCCDICTARWFRDELSLRWAELKLGSSWAEPSFSWAELLLSLAKI